MSHDALHVVTVKNLSVTIYFQQLRKATCELSMTMLFLRAFRCSEGHTGSPLGSLSSKFDLYTATWLTY
jgi:hypothetical protein